MTFGKLIALNDEKLGASAIADGSDDVRSDAESVFLERLRAGDARAFEQLVDRHSGEIYGLLLRILKDPEEASDVTQEVFLRAFKGISRFRGDANVRTWLYRIAINQSRNRYRWWKIRKRDKTVSLDSGPSGSEMTYSELIPAEDSGPEDEVLRQEQRRSLEIAIRALPKNFREAVVLCDVQGFTYEEIAKILEINIGTVKSRISRGRRELRQLLTDI